MKLSEELLQRHRIEIDAKPLLAALRELRRVPSRHAPALLDMLARRPTIVVMAQEHMADGVVLTAKPVRELVLFLKRARTCPTGPLPETRPENICSL